MSEIVLLFPQTELLNRVFYGRDRTKRKRNLTWASDLNACQVGDYCVVPLTSSKMLREEGRLMQHCVGDYDRLCHEGVTRVFSVQDLVGNRLATLSLFWHDDYWHLEQMKGPDNVEVLYEQMVYHHQEGAEERLNETDLYFVGQEILQRYRAAWSQRFYHYVVDLITPD